MAGVVPKETEERKLFLVLPDHCVVCLSTMCRDFHCSLMNYCCMIMVVACVCGGGCPQGNSLVYIRCLKWHVL